jgi:hypothetical protein
MFAYGPPVRCVKASCEDHHGSRFSISCLRRKSNRPELHEGAEWSEPGTGRCPVYSQQWRLRCDVVKCGPDICSPDKAVNMSYLTFDLLDVSNKRVTVRFVSSPQPTPGLGPSPGGQSFLTYVDRAHCTYSGAEHAIFEADLTALSAQPVTAKLDSNHYLGPDIGKCAG